jgi:hypothetical protein
MHNKARYRLRAAGAIAATVLALAVSVALAGCGSADTATPASSPTAQPTSAPGGGAGGTKLAPGLYDLEDGTVQAVGTVEYRDLEGGFWAVLGGSEAEGDAGKVVAVIVNGDEFADQFEEHEGLSFILEGERVDGASTRMAGPEITATKVTVAAEGGPAE